MFEASGSVHLESNKRQRRRRRDGSLKNLRFHMPFAARLVIAVGSDKGERGFDTGLSSRHVGVHRVKERPLALSCGGASSSSGVFTEENKARWERVRGEGQSPWVRFQRADARTGFTLAPSARGSRSSTPVVGFILVEIRR